MEKEMTTEDWYKRYRSLVHTQTGTIDRLKYAILPKEWQKSPEETGFYRLTWPTWQAAFLLRHADTAFTDDILNDVGEYMLDRNMEGLWDKGTGSKRFIMWDATSSRQLFAIFYCLFRDGRLIGQGWENLHFREGARRNVLAIVPLEELFDR